MTKYRCPTLGDCERANSGEIFERNAGDELKCPGCQTLLELHPSEQKANSSGTRRGKLVAAGALGVVVVAGAVAAIMHKATPAGTPAAAAVPVAVATVAPPPGSAGASPISPAAGDVQAQKVSAEVRLQSGDSSGAEMQSAKAASNEMVKLGIAQLGQGKLDEAERSFTSALKVDPRQSLAYYNMAVLRLRQGRSDDALKQFEASFMNGFAYFDKLDEDRDLDPIRQDKRFSELLARYRPDAQKK